VSAATLAFTSAAGAVTPAVKDSATCSALTGTVNVGAESAKGTLSGCTDTKNTDGGGKFSGNGNTEKASVTWDGGYGKTSTSFSYTIASSDACTGSQAGDEEIIVSGSVTKSTGKAVSIKAKQPLSADVCWNTVTNAISLLSGTKFGV